MTLVTALISLAGGCSRLTCEPDPSEPRRATTTPAAADEPLPLNSRLDDPWEVVDPYCGMRLRRDEAGATFEYHGQTYYFCMPDHRDAFARDPERYLASMDGGTDGEP